MIISKGTIYEKYSDKLSHRSQCIGKSFNACVNLPSPPPEITDSKSLNTLKLTEPEEENRPLEKGPDIIYAGVPILTTAKGLVNYGKDIAACAEKGLGTCIFPENKDGKPDKYSTPEAATNEELEEMANKLR